VLDMYQGGFGSWKEYKEDGKEKRSPTHKLLTNEEYDDLKSKIRGAQQEAQKAKEEASEAIEGAKRQIEAAQEEADHRIETIKAEVAYDELLRDTAKAVLINRERANKERGLRPKRDHTGYVVLRSQPTRYRRSNKSYVTLHETIIQSPYSIDFSRDQVEKQIFSELFDGQNLAGQIGISKRFDGSYDSLCMRGVPSDQNVVLIEKWSNCCLQDFNSGYWVCKFLHTKSIESVPENMRSSR